MNMGTCKCGKPANCILEDLGPHCADCHHKLPRVRIREDIMDQWRDAQEAASAREEAMERVELAGRLGILTKSGADHGKD